MFRTIWRWFLARSHLDDEAVCEMSKGLPSWGDYHDYHDYHDSYPMHFHTYTYTYTCKRCGKEFSI